MAVLVAALSAMTPVQAQVPDEAALKAKLTLSLTRFTQWPSSASDATLQICVAQRDIAIALAFAKVDGQMINGRRIEVLTAPPVAGCDVLFVHGSVADGAEVIRAASRSPVLIVGDAASTLALGGMVEFVAVNDSIRFDINMAAVRQAQLTMSSQVLKLARQVRE